MPPSLSLCVAASMPAGLRKSVTPSASVHLLMTLFGMSEKSRYLPSGTQSVPSVHLKPSASFSSLASLGISLSKRGSLRSMVPNVGYDFFSCATVGTVTAMARTAAASSRRFMGVHPGRVGMECAVGSYWPKTPVARSIRRRLRLSV